MNGCGIACGNIAGDGMNPCIGGGVGRSGLGS